MIRALRPTGLRRLPAVLVPLALIVPASCGGETAVAPTSPPTTTMPTSPTEPSEPAGPITLRYDFVDGSDGWASDVSDFSDATRPEDVVSETGVEPPGIDTTDGTFHLAASNRSDDVFVYMSRRVGPDDGLAPDASYRIAFEVVAASNAPSNCVGIGGAPGEAVWLKVGASTRQPTPVEEDGDTRLNIDKGNQSQGGEDAEVAGDIANGIPCEEALDAGSPYAMVSWEHELTEPVETHDAGELWLLVGTDSGFEGRSGLYYDTVRVTLTPQP